MPKTRFDWIVITALAAILGSLWIGMTRAQASDARADGRPPAPQLGHPAPDFTLQTLLDGQPIQLSRFAGKPVLMNFWATWCAPCRAEIPALELAARQLEGRAVVLGINVQEPPEIVAPFMKEMGMTYPVALDSDAQIAQLYRVRAFPTSFFVNAQGVIVQIEAGAISEALILKRLGDLAGD